MYLLQRIFSHSPLWRKTSDGPYADLDSHEELFTTHIPYALVRQRLLHHIRNNISIKNQVKMQNLLIKIELNKNKFHKTNKQNSISYLTTKRRDAAAVLQLGRWQHAAPNLHHVVRNGQSELFHIQICVKIRTTHQIVDLAFSV